MNMSLSLPTRLIPVLLAGLLLASSVMSEVRDGSAPNFTLPDRGGQNVTLSDFSGQLVCSLSPGNAFAGCVVPTL
jgi:hypothetical protein